MKPKEIENRLQKLKDEIFTTLRQEEDRKRELSQDGAVSIDPHTLNTLKANMVGPYTFNTLFKGIPAMTFGQVNHTNSADNFLDGISPLSSLYLVIPYVAKWNFSQGSVDGFYLGLYPLLAAPANIKKHTIMWHASGKASQNRNQHIRSSWTDSYSSTTATNLIQTDANIDKQ